MKQIINRELLLYLVTFLAFAFFLAGISATLAKSEGVAYKTFSWLELYGNLTIRFFVKIIYVFVTIFGIQYVYTKSWINKWVAFGLHIFFGVALTFYSIYTQIVLNNLFYGLDDPTTWEYVYTRALLGTDYNFFLYFCMAAITYAYYSFQKQKNAELLEVSLKNQLLDSKVNSLQMQLQPHFLFNTLNDISSLVPNKPEVAQDCIADLSTLLRQTLELNEVKFIALVEEIQLLEKYLEIEKTRFQNKLILKTDFSSELNDVLVPPLLLQPIVENSIKHGFSYKHDNLVIEMKIFRQNQRMHYEIRNNGKVLNDEEVDFGIGLSNIIERLNTLYDGDFEFEMYNLGESLGVETKLNFPMTKSSY